MHRDERVGAQGEALAFIRRLPFGAAEVDAATDAHDIAALLSTLQRARFCTGRAAQHDESMIDPHAISVRLVRVGQRRSPGTRASVAVGDPVEEWSIPVTALYRHPYCIVVAMFRYAVMRLRCIRDASAMHPRCGVGGRGAP